MMTFLFIGALAVLAFLCMAGSISGMGGQRLLPSQVRGRKSEV